MPHQPRRFVAFVDFVTSPGTTDWEGRPHPRRENTGPSELVTGRGRFSFAGGVLTLLETFAPFARAEAVEGFPFEVEADAGFRVMVALPAEHLKLAAKLSG
jgi:hypothetical protein